MSFDTEFDETFDGSLEDDNIYDRAHKDDPSDNAELSHDGFDPIKIEDPLSAYFFLSDDAQDEIDGNGSDGKKMKCRSCEHLFRGEDFDCCPKCGGFDTEEVFRDMDF